MKIKNYTPLLLSLLISCPITVMGCPTCVGRIQNHESNTFFSEEETTGNNNESTSAPENQGSAS